MLQCLSPSTSPSEAPILHSAQGQRRGQGAQVSSACLQTLLPLDKEKNSDKERIKYCTLVEDSNQVT
jgi:hypothetical protein